MKEIFKDIIGYEGLYQVSNMGNVKSFSKNKLSGNGYVLKERILKPGIGGGGYLHINLYNRQLKTIKIRKIHQLVAEAFLNHKPRGHIIVIDHKDFDRKNNKLSNLRIITNRNNTNQKHIKSSSRFVGVCWHKNHKKWISQIYINGKIKHLGYFINELEASDAYQKEIIKINSKQLI